MLAWYWDLHVALKVLVLWFVFIVGLIILGALADYHARR